MIQTHVIDSNVTTDEMLKDRQDMASENALSCLYPEIICSKASVPYYEVFYFLIQGGKNFF
jgi:hypothetical protein